MGSEARRVPLCVDLDGTLIRSDLLIESFFALLRHNIAYLLLVPLWLLKGKAPLKAEIARRAELDVVTLPYHEAFLGYLRNEQSTGRQLFLVTASNEKYARQVATHLGLFTAVLASDEKVNLKGAAKAESLSAHFGHRGFDYAGNGRADLAVFACARRALLVEPSPGVRAAAARLTEIAKVLECHDESLLNWVRTLRLHRWLKNLLVFVPIIAAHRLGDLTLVGQTLLAFIAFGLCASGGYVLNDLLDLPSDRAHPRKRQRPFAAGRLSIISAMWTIPLLLAVAFAIASALPWEFAGVLAGYLVLTLAYSLWLKQELFVGVIVLAGLSTVRILAGSAATAIAPTFWLLAFSMFLFLSMAMLKRYVDLFDFNKTSKVSTTGYRYRIDDFTIIQSFGAVSGYLSVLVLALYINSDEARLNYSRPEVIWFLCPLLLYWISRMWRCATRGMVQDDPIVFVANETISRWLAVTAGIILWLAV